jgi:hypothetical protein
MQSVQTQLLRVLVARGIPVMALKGLALALRHFGQLALRPTTDIDILVPRERVSDACAVLLAMGYHPSAGSGKPTGFNAQTHCVVDYLGPGSPQVEIHWELFNYAAYRAGLPAAAAWARAERTTLFGQSVRYLDPADELRYLSVHYAAEHHLARLMWGVDLVQIVGGLPATWDWNAFVRETIGAQLALPVATALADCQRRLALRLPPGVLGTLKAAAGSDAERTVWAASQSQPYTAPWIRAQAAALRGPLEWGVFLRGVLAPRAPALAELYGAPSAVWPGRARTHLRHLRRVAPALAAAVGPERTTQAGVVE